jgi:hypothetical protein
MATVTRRIAGGALVAALALAAGCGGTEETAPQPTTAPATTASTLPLVTCEESIGGARYSGTDEGARILLGAISVPPEYRPEAAVPSGDKRWPFVAEVDVVFRAEQPPVDVVVPKEWRKRAAISLGNTKLASSLQVSACPNNGLPWNAFTLGFNLQERTACVPLAFRVGARTTTARFGLGKHCTGA